MNERTENLLAAVKVLAGIAEAYDANKLDNEARKTWGANDEHTNTTPPEQIELYQGRGGKSLLTLADCLEARKALQEFKAALRRCDYYTKFHHSNIARDGSGRRVEEGWAILKSQKDDDDDLVGVVDTETQANTIVDALHIAS